MKIVRALWFLLAFSSLVACAHIPSRNTQIGKAASVAFYVEGHEDDWEIFSGDRAAADAAAGRKMVFVYATAGEGRPDRSKPWRAREAGAKACTELILPPGRIWSWSCGTATIRGHDVSRCTFGPSVSYFLRLKDGVGFAALKDGGRAEAIDQSTSYENWKDFCSTLRAIIELEAAGVAEADVRINAHDWNRDYNDGDHPDHRASGEAVRDVAAGRQWLRIWYKGYRTIQVAPNLTAKDYMIKAGLFLAYDRAVRLNSEGTPTPSGFHSYVTYCEDFAAPALYSEYLWRTCITRSEGGRDGERREATK